jgi:hypothetical protein
MASIRKSFFIQKNKKKHRKTAWVPAPKEREFEMICLGDFGKNGEMQGLHFIINPKNKNLGRVF